MLGTQHQKTKPISASSTDSLFTNLTTFVMLASEIKDSPTLMHVKSHAPHCVGIVMQTKLPQSKAYGVFTFYYMWLLGIMR